MHAQGHGGSNGGSVAFTLSMQPSPRLLCTATKQKKNGQNLEEDVGHNEQKTDPPSTEEILMEEKGFVALTEMSLFLPVGQVLDSRSQSPWRLSFITDFFWGIAEFVVLFFKTLLQQDVKKRRGYGSSSDSRYDDGRGYSF
ncbi:hypothetical protein HPG69_008103 [Diceros bicornis minor]|uniref:Selenoprotein K n=1 Tax=Diceros bicornis minor TaxID=77932 RepID=A0A7J7F3V7_DICBM|nr:hypothetical protein HPG69_008103 [Diceros bicornis minor]